MRPVWQVGAGVSQRWVFNIVIYVVGTITLLAAIGIIMLSTGASVALIAAVLALFPLTIVILGVLWLDRWEPESRSLMLVALLWGAGVAVFASLFGNEFFILSIYSSIVESTGDTQLAAERAQVLGPVVVAPVVEEITKGLGVLAIFLLRREHFDGPVDGVVFAALVGGGFAFTENILYFGRFAGDEQHLLTLGIVFVMRGLLSPFAHAIFTASMGIALGLVAHRRWTVGAFIAFPIGLIAAMALHALWNASTFLDSMWLLYALVQVPLFLAIIGLMLWLRRQESNVIRARLTEYARAGWFEAHEVDMLSSLRLRSQARQWASGFGSAAREAMVMFQRHATQLAYQRQHVLRGRGQKRAHASEHELLNRLHQDRRRFLEQSQGV